MHELNTIEMKEIPRKKSESLAALRLFERQESARLTQIELEHCELGKKASTIEVLIDARSKEIRSWQSLWMKCFEISSRSKPIFLKFKILPLQLFVFIAFPLFLWLMFVLLFNSAPDLLGVILADRDGVVITKGGLFIRPPSFISFSCSLALLLSIYLSTFPFAWASSLLDNCFALS